MLWFACGYFLHEFLCCNAVYIILVDFCFCFEEILKKAQFTIKFFETFLSGFHLNIHHSFTILQCTVLCYRGNPLLHFKSSTKVGTYFNGCSSALNFVSPSSWCKLSIILCNHIIFHAYIMKNTLSIQEPLMFSYF